MKRFRIVVRVLRDPQLRRVELGLVAFTLCETGTWLAITVFAYDRGGVGHAGLVSFLQLVPAAVAAPFVAYAADRLPRSRALAAGFLLQALTFALAAAAMLAGLGIVAIYGAAIAAAIAVTFTRPAVGAVLPSLVRVPIDLTAANVASSFAQGLGMLLGPALAGLVLVAYEPGAVFAAAAVLMTFVSLATIGLRLQPGADPLEHDEHVEMSPAELVAGLSLLRRDRDIRLLIGLLTASFMVVGALDIAFVVVAIELLDRTEASAGVFSAAAGFGSVIGAGGSVGLVEQRRLTRPLGWGVAVAGLALAGVAVSGDPFVVALLFALGGIGFSVADISGRTMLQGLAPDDVLARIFGLLEGLSMAGLALGGLGFSGLALAFGVEGALVALGLALPLVVTLRLGRLLRIDASRPEVDPDLFALIRRVPIFAPLPAYAVEQLLVNFAAVTYAPGVEVIRIGESGDEFYVVVEGTAEVVTRNGGRRQLGPGEYFGEIALLRDVPRTATVRSGPTGVVVQVLERDVFLAAVTGHARSRSRVEATATRRFGEATDHDG